MLFLCVKSAQVCLCATQREYNRLCRSVNICKSTWFVQFGQPGRCEAVQVSAQHFTIWTGFRSTKFCQKSL